MDINQLCDWLKARAYDMQDLSVRQYVNDVTARLQEMAEAQRQAQEELIKGEDDRGAVAD